MRGSDMFRDIRNHGGTTLQVFMQKVSAELEIDDAACEDSESDDGQYRNNGDEQIGHDEPVPQTPEQPASPPTHKTDEHVDGREYRQILDEVENAAAQP